MIFEHRTYLPLVGVAWGLSVTMFWSLWHPAYAYYWYRKNVIAGTNAFIVVAKNFVDFERAIIRKLMREIVDAGPHQDFADAQRP